MARVSERFRRFLRERCERLIEAGVNCFPKWIRGRAPAFRTGERYQRFLTVPIKGEDEFKRLILSRFDDPRVGGIVIAGRVGGVVAIDCDAPKVANMERRILGLVKELGHMVYLDRRVVLSPGVGLRGLHAVLFVDTELLNRRTFKIQHDYRAEFAVKDYGLITISPSLRIDGGGGGGELSVYLRISSADVLEAVYDERLEVLPKVVEMLGGRLVVQPIDQSRAEAAEYSGNPGEPWHGLRYGEINADNVFLFLKNLARVIHCEGLLRLVESLEAGEPMPMPYVLYNQIVHDANHPRSSWTLAENVVGRILGEVGADESALTRVREAFERAERGYERVNGSVDHRTLRNNLTRAYRFKEFGHDRPGACIFYLVGLCSENCGLTCWLKLRSQAAREALEKAAALAIAGREVGECWT